MVRHEHDGVGDWDWDWDDERPRRSRRRARESGRSPIGRAFSLLKFAVFLIPVGLFLFSFFADCRQRPSFTSFSGVLGATACARNEMIGNGVSLPENLAALRRLIN
jgi:hypothetical protein